MLTKMHCVVEPTFIMHTKWVKQWKSAIHLFLSSHLISHECNSDGSAPCFTCFYALFSRITYDCTSFIWIQHVYEQRFSFRMTNVCIPRVSMFPMFFFFFYSSFEKKLDGREMKKETNIKKWESNGKRCMRHIFPVIWDKGSAKVRSNIPREKYSRICICITWMKKNSFKLPPTFSMDIHIYNFVYVTWQVLRATHISLSSFFAHLWT